MLRHGGRTAVNTLCLLCHAGAVALLAALSCLESLRLSSPVEKGMTDSWTSLTSLTRLTALDLSWCNRAKCGPVNHVAVQNQHVRAIVVSRSVG